MIKDFKQGIKLGTMSVIVSLFLTYLFHLIRPSTDLQWAMIAVAIASFLSGFFSSQY